MNRVIKWCISKIKTAFTHCEEFDSNPLITETISHLSYLERIPLEYLLPSVCGEEISICKINKKNKENRQGEINGITNFNRPNNNINRIISHRL